MRVRFLLLMLLLVVPACAMNRVRPLEPREARILPHAVFINNNGDAVLPRVEQKSVVLTPDRHREELRAMMRKIRNDSASLKDGKRKILIRIHGGLNQLSGSLRTSLWMMDSLRADAAVNPKSNYYPIFVNWESGLQSAYLEHLLVVRRGQRRPNEWFWAPFYFAADLGGGAARSPLTWGRQLNNFRRDGVRNYEKAYSREDPEPARPLSRQEAGLMKALATEKGIPADSLAMEPERMEPGALPEQGNTLDFSRFAYNRSRQEAVVHHGTAGALSLTPTRVLLYPARGVLGVVGWVPLKPLGVALVDAFGTPAWENMHRRTKTMFRADNEFERTEEKAHDYAPPRGAAAIFLEELQRLVDEDSTTEYEITLMGHSMGAIVASEMVRTADRLPWRNIVFMAPALSTREFQLSVLPYLEKHDSTQFYVLTLHPMAERRESNFFRLAPYGSLLEWIDSYFGRPETDLDQMMGKYDNVHRASVVIPESVRGRFHIKAFGYNDGTGCGRNNAYPYKHGHFNEPGVPYWRPEFWHPGSEGCEAIKARR